jgi:tetratricopeptide (TPR) repeat protein
VFTQEYSMTKAWATILLFMATASLPGCGSAHSDASTTAMSPCRLALAAGGGADSTADALRMKAQSGPHADQSLEQLGFHYISRARRTNDPGDYRLVEQVAGCLESRAPGRANALLLRGHALHQLHRFKEAEMLARQLVARREFVLDFGLLGDTLLEQGQIAGAAEAYQRMIDLKPFYQSYIRAAHLRWIKGDLRGALDLARQAIAAASPRDSEAVAWAHTRVAQYELQAGRARDARRGIDAALTALPDYAAALLLRGRLQMLDGQIDDGIADLRRAAALNPLPEYQWTLADAYRTAGRPGEAAAIERELEAAGDRSDPRTLSLFLATRRHRTAFALELAERELEVRADVFTLDAYAWALAAEGRVVEASAAMTRALAAGTEDARLFLHAAAIAAAAGERAEAGQWHAKARAARLTLLPSELDVLRAHINPPITEEN